MTRVSMTRRLILSRTGLPEGSGSEQGLFQPGPASDLVWAIPGESIFVKDPTGSSSKASSRYLPFTSAGIYRSPRITRTALRSQFASPGLYRRRCAQTGSSGDLQRVDSNRRARALRLDEESGQRTPPQRLARAH